MNDHDVYGFPEEVEPYGRARVGDELPAHKLFTTITDAACKAGKAAKECKCDDRKPTPSITVTGSDGTKYTMDFGAGIAGWILFGLTFAALVAREAWRMYTRRSAAPVTVRNAGNVVGGNDAALPPPPPHAFEAGLPPPPPLTFEAIEMAPASYSGWQQHEQQQQRHPYKAYNARTAEQDTALNWAAQY